MNYKQLVEKVLNEGENKEAKWSKKFKSLEYWNSRNTITTVQCDDKNKANAIIAKSGIDQSLKIVENVLEEKPSRKPAFGEAEGKSYAVQINSLDTNEFFKQSFGRSMGDWRKAQQFVADPSTKKDYVDAKGKPTMASVKKWVKDMNPSEFYAKWQKDSSSWKDDSVEIFYKK